VSLLRRTVVAGLAVACLPVRGQPAGNLRVGGSGACHGGTVLLGERFAKSVGGNAVAVAPPLGSRGGIRGLLGGALDIACTSRVLTSDEQASGLTAYPIAASPFVVIVHPDTRLTTITVAELTRFFADPSATFSDGTRARPVLRPADEADTHILLSLSPAMAPALAQARLRPGMLMAATDREVANFVETVPGAIGLSTLGLVQTERRGVTVLGLAGHLPVVDGRANPRYPVRKTVYFVTRDAAPESVMRFVAYARSRPAQDLLLRNGFLPSAPGAQP
jgi:phosphate transport system substrate-binding protein